MAIDDACNFLQNGGEVAVSYLLHRLSVCKIGKYLQTDELPIICYFKTPVAQYQPKDKQNFSFWQCQ